ncbi:hypothetical protein SGFS_034640 [Streptomyces graminofaciens]|uniref:Uncharacterized protein n=1 Tax=Streptomyces graminofaciens TaxID=68212 RepID=A0ABN5VFU8_9ACTN|nr:hypothetical protein SGFS_034640 [Streptomyces graminofaciens]
MAGVKQGAQQTAVTAAGAPFSPAAAAQRVGAPTRRTHPRSVRPVSGRAGAAAQPTRQGSVVAVSPPEPWTT